MNVYQKLNDAREKFHSLELKKTGHNKFAGYHYFELGDFLIPAMKVFREVGLCAMVSFEAEQARMTIINVEKPEERITFHSPMGSANLKGCHEVQNIGAVETYQRRYLWVAALEIVEHDALDAGSPRDEQPKPKRTGVAQDVLSESPAIPRERQDELRELAQTVAGDLSAYGAEAAYERIEQEGLDNVEKIFMATFLDASQRRALKDYSIQLHSKKAA